MSHLFPQVFFLSLVLSASSIARDMEPLPTRVPNPIYKNLELGTQILKDVVDFGGVETRYSELEDVLSGGHDHSVVNELFSGLFKNIRHHVYSHDFVSEVLVMLHVGFIQEVAESDKLISQKKYSDLKEFVKSRNWQKWNLIMQENLHGNQLSIQYYFANMRSVQMNLMLKQLSEDKHYSLKIQNTAEALLAYIEKQNEKIANVLALTESNTTVSQPVRTVIVRPRILY